MKCILMNLLYFQERRIFSKVNMAENKSLPHSQTHEIPEEGQIICAVCKKSFPIESNLQEHMKTHEKEGGQCEKCDETFSSKLCLQKLMFRSDGIKSFQCEKWEKSFAYPSHLKRHLQSHGGERPLHCQYCEKSFRYECDLKRHVRTHTGEKPYTCKTCNQSFSRNSHLEQHKVVHTGENHTFVRNVGNNLIGRIV